MNPISPYDENIISDAPNECELNCKNMQIIRTT